MVMAEKDTIRNGLYIGALLNNLHIEKPVTYIRFSSYAFGSSTFTKRQGGHMLSSKKSSADGPAPRPDGPRSGQSVTVARTVRAHREPVNVPSFLLRLLANLRH